MKNNFPLELIKKILERDRFKCQKCGFEDLSGDNLEIHHINPRIFNGSNEISNLSTLCSICHKYAPDTEKEFKKYVTEKVDSKLLETFRKSDYSISKKTKVGMINAFKIGRHITKAPLGYKLVNKQLLINPDQKDKIKSIFEEFLNSNISLTQLALKNGFTTSGVIKLLSNTTYLGKVKFANHETEGQHEPLVDKHLFEQVQNKLNHV